MSCIIFSFTYTGNFLTSLCRNFITLSDKKKWMFISIASNKKGMCQIEKDVGYCRNELC